MYRQELKATVPREILDCAAVSREINFSSQEEIRQFRLEQRVFLDGACIEGAYGSNTANIHVVCVSETYFDCLSLLGSTDFLVERLRRTHGTDIGVISSITYLMNPSD